MNLLISTINSGIERLNNVIHELRSDVEYIVTHKFTNERYRKVLELLNRDDITVSQMPGKSVAKFRNNSIGLVDGEIGLFSDADVTYRQSYFDTLNDVFESNNELDIALFKIKTPEGEPEYKNYPSEREKITKSPSVGTVEIAFRVQSVKKKKFFLMRDLVLARNCLQDLMNSKHNLL